MFRFAFETMPEKIVALNLTCIKTFYHIVSYLLLRSYYIVNSSRAIKFSTNRMEKIKHRPVPLGQWNANFMFTCTHTHWPLSLDTWFHIDRSIVSHLRDIFITQTNECTHNKKNTSTVKNAPVLFFTMFALRIEQKLNQHQAIDISHNASN